MDQKEKDPNLKINTSEFFEISKWILKFYYKLNPNYVTKFAFFSMLVSLVPLVNIYVVTRIIDTVIARVEEGVTDLTTLIPWIAAMLGINFLVLIIRYANGYYDRAVHYFFDFLLRQALYEQNKKLGIETLEYPEINDKLDRARNELYKMGRFFNYTIELISEIVSLMATATIIFTTLPILIVLVLISTIPNIFIDKKYRRLVWKFIYDHTQQRRAAHRNSVELESSEGLKEIFINNAFDYFSNKYTSFFDWYMQERVNISNKWSNASYSAKFLNEIMIAIAYVVVISRALIDVAFTVGDLLFQIRIMQRFSYSLTRIFKRTNELTEMALRVKDAYEFFNYEPRVKDGKVKMQKLEKGPEIKFEDVNFAYPNTEKLIYKDLNLTIKPGEKIAIVGHNGAGKTTLVKLICRIYQPQQGKIYINGENLRDLQLESFYKNIGVLFQDYNQYAHITVKENIAVGDPDKPVNMKKVIQAAKDADAYDFIQKLDKGFDQMLSPKYDDGVRLSTGQWQKLAIARFFYTNAPLVIFDEPTAAIDAISEYNIFNKIYKFFENKTVLIISHRFSTVRNADRILVVKEGEVIEQGSHTELMELDGYYAESFKLQAEGYTD